MSTLAATARAQELALGTVQFGLDYGITNSAGRVQGAAAASLLQAAWDGGVRRLDTAAAYGSSEAELGTAFAAGPPRPWRVITKTLPLRCDAIGAAELAAVAAAFETSLQRLGRPGVDALLVHHAPDLLAPGGERLHAWMREEQARGRVARIGVSVYDGEQVRALGDRFRFDVVQLPASIADQRLLRDGTIERLAAQGTEVHVRSLYLQGLMLAAPEFIAQRFPRQAAWAQGFHAACRERSLSPAEACLSFFRAQRAFAVAVVGAASADELSATLAAWQRAPAMDWSAWAVDNPDFTDPRRWTAS